MNVAALLHPDPAPPRLFRPPSPPQAFPAQRPPAQVSRPAKPLYRPPRTPSPAPAQRVHLGTHPWPFTPFPYQLAADDGDGRVVGVRIVFSGACVAASLAARADPPLWGGAPDSPGPRVYTDDSNPLLAALHAGRLAPPHSQHQAAVLELRLWPDTAGYKGAPGNAGLASKDWRSAHDGCAFEVVGARWTSDSICSHLPSTCAARKQRVHELADRARATLRGLPSPSPTLAFAPAGRVALKYNPAAMRDRLFPPSDAPASKRRRTEQPASAAAVPPQLKADIVFRPARPTKVSTAAAPVIILRPEEASTSPAVKVTPPNPNGVSKKRKRSANSSPPQRYSVLTSHLHELAFVDPPLAREEQMRLYGAPLRGPPPAPASPRSANVPRLEKKDLNPDPKAKERALLRRVRDADLEFLPKGIALWVDGRLCFWPVRAWWTR
ncbi:hypothetical protein AURDEDRAFT_136469 [Auricularia subglabra TFB-10046 SS5]|nr:hypothetical protein AURDEDRAFT_136469 [Auricularia subglabra TFB-10046 SS5]